MTSFCHMTSPLGFISCVVIVDTDANTGGARTPYLYTDNTVHSLRTLHTHTQKSGPYIQSRVWSTINIDARPSVAPVTCASCKSITVSVQCRPITILLAFKTIAMAFEQSDYSFLPGFIKYM